jgi:hypothetical protein
MDTLDTARALRDPIGDVGGRFMLDGATYADGMAAGFSGLDFYVAGRCGVLGPVDADVVVAELGFFEPGYVRTNWEAGLAVMAPEAAAARFMACGCAWARDHLPEDLDAARLAELARRVTDATGAERPLLYRRWAAQPWPDGDREAALFGIHLLRELRGGEHVRAAREHDLDPHGAVVLRSGAAMAGIFGWSEPHPDQDLARERWTLAEARTDELMAPAFEVLDDAERDELVELAVAAAA